MNALYYDLLEWTKNVFIRHFSTQGPTCKFSGSPLAPSPLLWVKKNLSPSFKTRNCSAMKKVKVGPREEPRRNNWWEVLWLVRLPCNLKVVGSYPAAILNSFFSQAIVRLSLVTVVICWSEKKPEKWCLVQLTLTSKSLYMEKRKFCGGQRSTVGLLSLLISLSWIQIPSQTKSIE